MSATLRLSLALHQDLMAHLLQTGSYEEQAAFLFVSSNQPHSAVQFEVLDFYKAGLSDFAEQAGDYLELADDVRAMLIKRAHDLDASLVEFHSHPGPWPAAFSLEDRIGLRETVRHMWWRLKGRPYLAIVVANRGFDALLWLDDPKIPQPLDGLLVGSRVLLPTNNSLEGWG